MTGGAQSKRLPGVWCECCVLRERWQQPSGRMHFPAAQQDVNDKTRDPSETTMDCVRSMRVSAQKRFKDSWDLDVSGGFGTVWKATHRRGIVGAVKKVPKKDLKFNLILRRELSLLRNIKHPRVCRLMAPFEEEKYMYMVMEYVEGWELFEGVFDWIRCGTFNEQVCSAMMYQMFEGLNHCHRQGVLHRDLRPSNIMIVKPTHFGEDENRINIKLVNFGVQLPYQSLGGCSTQLEKATAFRSPESRESGTFSMSSDVWSMGALLFVMIVGRIPCAFGLHDQLKEVASDKLRDLLSGLLHKDASSRLSTSKALQHSWIADFSTDTTEQQEDTNLFSTSAFTTFYQHDKLQTAVLAAMDSEVAGQQIGSLQDQLHAQSEGSGEVSREKLLLALKATSIGLRVGFFFSQIAQLEEEIAFQGANSLLNLDSWKMIALQAFTCAASEAAEAAFKSLDLSGSGSVELADLCKILKVSSVNLVCRASAGGIRLQGSVDFEAFEATLTMLAETAAAMDNGGAPASSPCLPSRVKSDTSLNAEGAPARCLPSRVKSDTSLTAEGAPASRPCLPSCVKSDSSLSAEGDLVKKCRSAPTLVSRRRSLTAYDCPASLLKVSGALGMAESRKRLVAFENEAQVVLIPETPANIHGKRRNSSP